MKIATPLLLAAAAIICLAIAGARPFGKIAFAAGWYELSAQIFTTPGARGVSYYHSGRFAKADEAFKKSGGIATYNRGLSLATVGRYKLSVAYFDAVLFASPDDKQVQEDRAIVAELIEKTDPYKNTVRGRIAAIVDAAAADRAEIVDETSSEQNRLQRRGDRRNIVADDAWLETLADAPGEFLKKQLQAEYDRRKKNGLVVSSEERSW